MPILTLKVVQLRGWFHPLTSAIFVARVQEIASQRFSGIVCNIDICLNISLHQLFNRIYVKPPGHATVDGKVDGVGEADEHVDEEDDLAGHLVVKELHHAEICFFYSKLIIFPKQYMFVLFSRENNRGNCYLDEIMCKRPRTIG